MKRARLVVDSSPEPPFEDSIGVATASMREALRANGYRVQQTVARAPRPEQRLIPLEAAARIAALRSVGHDELRVFADRSLDLAMPERHGRSKNVIYFHGLAYHPAAFLQGDAIDAYCTNSPYVLSVLLSLAPVPSARRPGASGPWFACIPPVVPTLAAPRGYESVGAELGDAFAGREGAGVRFGHGLRAGKCDPLATLAIVWHLNALGAHVRPRQRTFYFVSEVDARRLRDAAIECGHLDALRFLLPLPHLTHRALQRLVRRCDFSLCYDVFPEPFGFYPLESVVGGVPVYTSGVGNLRHLLPEGCGVRVQEDFAMAFGPPARRWSALEKVAARIAADIASGEGRAACAKGTEIVRERYGPAAARRGWADLARVLDGARKAPRVDPAGRDVTLSPLVRAWDPASGRVLSDFGNETLPERENLAIARYAGRPYRDAARSPRDRDALLRLFHRGLLSLEAPDEPVFRWGRR